MPDKKPKPQDTELKSFIKSGGRNNAEADFNTILERAAQPKKDMSSKPADKKKKT